MLGAHQDAVVGEEVLRRLAPELPGVGTRHGPPRRPRAGPPRRGPRRLAGRVAPSSRGARRRSGHDARRRPPRLGRRPRANGTATTACGRSTRRGASRRRGSSTCSPAAAIGASSAARTCAASRRSSRSRAARGLEVEAVVGARPSTSSRDGPPSSPRCSATTTPSPASTAGSSARSGSTCASEGRRLALRGRARAARDPGRRALLRGAARGESRAAAPSRRPPAPSWNGAPRHRVSSRRMIAPAASVAARGSSTESWRASSRDGCATIVCSAPVSVASSRRRPAIFASERALPPTASADSTSRRVAPARAGRRRAPPPRRAAPASAGRRAAPRREPQRAEVDRVRPERAALAVADVISVEPPPTSHTATGPPPTAVVAIAPS